MLLLEKHKEPVIQKNKGPLFPIVLPEKLLWYDYTTVNGGIKSSQSTFESSDNLQTHYKHTKQVCY